PYAPAALFADGVQSGDPLQRLRVADQHDVDLAVRVAVLAGDRLGGRLVDLAAACVGVGDVVDGLERVRIRSVGDGVDTEVVDRADGWRTERVRHRFVGGQGGRTDQPEPACQPDRGQQRAEAQGEPGAGGERRVESHRVLHQPQRGPG